MEAAEGNVIKKMLVSSLVCLIDIDYFPLMSVKYSTERIRNNVIHLNHADNFYASKSYASTAC